MPPWSRSTPIAKKNAGPTYKGGFGFHPMFCFADATGETLSGLLRPGNAGANTVADHVTVLDQAIAQLPAAIASGHRAGDDADWRPGPSWSEPTRPGAPKGSFGLSGPQCLLLRRRHDRIPRSRRPSVTPSASSRCGSRPSPKTASPRMGTSVCELTSLVTDHKLPEGTRLIVRREPLHPGAQRSLFPSLEYRYWGFYTDAEGARSTWTPPCGPMPMSNSTSSG